MVGAVVPTLFRIITQGCLDELQAALEQDTRYVNEGDEDNLTPLHLAVDQGREDMVHMLLQFGAEVNVRTHEARLTPLHIAVRNCNPAITDRLLEAGADVNSRNKIDHTPLHVAVSTKSIEMARLLLLWKADPNVITKDPRRETPLLKAATTSLSLSRLLMDAGAGLSSESKELHVAILANKPDIACLLLDRMEKTAEERRICLKPNRIGRSHLQSVASHIQNCEPQLAVSLAQRLLRLGENVNYANQFGTVFHILVTRGLDDVSAALFDLFLSVPGRDCDKALPLHGTPLSLAVKLGQSSFALKLIKEGFSDARQLRLDQLSASQDSVRILKLLFFEGLRFPDLRSSLRSSQDREADSHVAFEEFVSWVERSTRSVLPLKALVRIYLRSNYKHRCSAILSALKVPKLLCNYVHYRSSSVEQDFL